MSLKIIIASLYSQVSNPDCKIASITLSKGLRIEAWKESEHTLLKLSRADVYPSAAEWHTVIAQWPRPVTCNPLRSIENRRLCLISELVEAALLIDVS